MILTCLSKVPTADFSSEADTARPRRPPRRAGRDGGRDGGWNDDRNDDRGATTSRRRESSSGWDDDWSADQGDDAGGSSYEPYTYGRQSDGGNDDDRRGSSRGSGGGGGEWGDSRGEYQRRRGGRGRGRGRDGDRGGRREDRRPGRGGGRGRGRGGRGDRNGSDGQVRINLRLIEESGLQHIYGIAPVLNALRSDVRDFEDPEEIEDEEVAELKRRLAGSDGFDDDEDEEEGDDGDFYEKKDKREIKPEAQLKPRLFVQEGTLSSSRRSFRTASKAEASSEIVALAEARGLPVAEVDKGVLNTLCSNRPHQGFVLRCGGREFESLGRLPRANDGDGPGLWLALDEVVDPQNLGE